MQVTLDIPDELAAAVKAQGYSLDAYVRGLMEERLSQESAEKARRRKAVEAMQQFAHKHGNRSVAEAIDGIRELRKGNRLDGLEIRDLIDEGRRF